MTLMYFVDVYELDKLKHQKKVATFKFGEETFGSVQVEGETANPVVDSVIREGIFDYKFSRPGRLYPYDGMSFLENLKYNLRSGYLSATDVQQKAVDS
ncbi:MAG TPA: hypothetical protein VJ046_01235 [Candidatus Paceibacterota bacterium]|nr:hypothetical protein [Candidatus Paceibacterota bacterium]